MTIETRISELSAKYGQQPRALVLKGFDYRNDLVTLIRAAQQRVDAAEVALTGNPSSTPIVAAARGHLALALTACVRPPNYPAVFDAIARAESAADELEAM
ncbi:MAG: hypothetical protein HGA71_15545 [Azonexaceae bacterium]|nr:hypothetical protein [Azonexaceae bacterium]